MKQRKGWRVMSDETRHAFFLGQEAMRTNSLISQFKVDDPLMYYWIKGRLGMPYRDPEVMRIEEINHTLSQRYINLKANNAVPADDFSKVKMEQAVAELEDMKLRYSESEEDKVIMRETINNLSAKLSKAGRSDKRTNNRAKL